MLDREQLEQRLAELPLLQYDFLTTDELVFTERVRYVCEHECPMYGKTWACPPAVGSVEQCKAKCLGYQNVLMITTMTEVRDAANMEEGLATRAGHEAVTHQAEAMMIECGAKPYVLSTEACAVCEHCAYPDGPCRHPEKMYPCVESHGILVTDIMEKLGMDFFNGNLITWSSLLFYN